MGLKNRRKKLIVYNLQIQLIIAILGLIVGVSVILVTSLFLIFKSNMSDLPITEESINEILYNSSVPVIIVGIIVFVVSLWAIILITHKIYGPLYRLSAYIRKLSNGEVTDELKFRRGDAIDGLKEIYNDLRQSLDRTLHYDYKEMVKIFAELEDALDKMYNKKIKDKQLYDSLQDACDRLAKALDITSEAIEEEK